VVAAELSARCGSEWAVFSEVIFVAGALLGVKGSKSRFVKRRSLLILDTMMISRSRRNTSDASGSFFGLIYFFYFKSERLKKL
jgi:hypothetical protein